MYRQSKEQAEEEKRRLQLQLDGLVLQVHPYEQGGGRLTRH